MKLFQLQNDFMGHFIISVPVTAEGFGILNVTRNGTCYNGITYRTEPASEFI